MDSVLFHDENELTQMKATDGDEGENGRVSYSWKSMEIFVINLHNLGNLNVTSINRSVLRGGVLY